MIVGRVVGEEADDVGAEGGKDVLYVRFRQALVATVAQAVGVHGLGDGCLAGLDLHIHLACNLTPSRVSAGELVFPGT